MGLFFAGGGLALDRLERQLPAQGETLCLGWIEGGVLLHPEAALRDYGIADGGRLILV